MSHITNIDWSKWDLIHPLVYQALRENNFNNPTDIQSYVLNCYRNHNDFLVASQTGSGKTLSFGIPIVSEIIYDKSGTFQDSKKNPKHNKKYIRCLIIAPTRELVLQIEKHLNQISQNAKKLIRIGSIVGGISKEKQRRVLSYVPDILIATPGRLWDMIDNYEHECLDNLHLLDYLVLDEADRMVELGHFDELDKILEKVYNKGEIVENKGEIQKINELISQKKTKTVQLRTKAPVKIQALENIGENEVLTISGDDAKKFFANLKKNNNLDSRELKGINLDFLDDEDYVNSTQDKETQGDNSEDLEEDDLDEEDLDEEDLDEEDVDEDDIDEEDIDEENVDEEDFEEDNVDADNDEEDNEEEAQSGEGEDEEEEDFEDEEEDQNEENLELDENEVEGGDEDEEINNENEEDLEDDNEEEDIEGIDETDKPKRNAKMKVFLVSATLTKQFAGNKHKIKTLSKKEKKKQQKERKDRKKDRKKGITTEEEKEEKLIPKMEALMQKVKFTGKYKVIDLTQTMLIPKNLKELKTVCVEEDKTLYLYHYIKERPNESFIVFTNSISYAKKIVNLLEILGLKVLCMHSEMQQRQRLKKLDQFKQGQYKILISTDVAARGLDIPSVENVVHYQVPLDVDTYIHRSGRTARIGKAGTCYTLIGPKDGQRFQKIINQLEKEQGIQNIEINHTERDKIRVLIESAQQLERSDFLVRSKQVEKAWFSKNAKLAELEVDEEIKSELNNIKEELTKKRVVMKQDKIEFKKIKEDVKQIHRKTNNMFLEPAQIHKYAERLEQLKQMKNKPKSQQKQQQQEQQQQQQHQQKGNKKFNKFNKDNNNKNKFNQNGNKNNNNNQNNQNNQNKFNKKRKFSQL